MTSQSSSAADGSSYCIVLMPKESFSCDCGNVTERSEDELTKPKFRSISGSVALRCNDCGKEHEVFLECKIANLFEHPHHSKSCLILLETRNNSVNIGTISATLKEKPYALYGIPGNHSRQYSILPESRISKKTENANRSVVVTSCSFGAVLSRMTHCSSSSSSLFCSSPSCF